MNNRSSSKVYMSEVGRIIKRAKALAKDYRRLTGRPLGITGEVAEYEAARLLGLQLSPVRQPGYDAIDENGTRIQIKGRVLPKEAKPGQRIGSIRLEHAWDMVILVLLDSEMEPMEIYVAKRPAIKKALAKPGSRARNERGALGVRQFKRIAERVWSQDPKKSGKPTIPLFRRGME